MSQTNTTIDTLRKIFSTPNEFFASLKNDGIAKPYGFFSLVGVFFAVLSGLIGYFQRGASLAVMQRMNVPIPNLGAAWLPLLIVGSYIMLHVGFWIGTTVLHLFFKIVGGKGSYAQTAQVFAYSASPRLVFGWIPVIGGLASIWTIVLYFISSMKVHKIGGGRATVAIIVLPIVLAIIIGFIVGGAVITALVANKTMM